MIGRTAVIHLDELTEDGFNYVEQSARIRRISCTRLLKRVLQTVIEDQLILSVLDDDSKQPRKLPNERTNSRFHKSRC